MATYEQYRKEHDDFLSGMSYTEHENVSEIPGMRMKRYIREDGAVLCEDIEYTKTERFAGPDSWKLETVVTMHVEWWSYGAKDCNGKSQYCHVEV